MSSSESKQIGTKSDVDLGKLKQLFSNERADLLTLAKTAELAERFEDMCKFMRELVVWSGKNPSQEWNVEERNLLSVAYKNVIGARRTAWRQLNSDDQKDSKIIVEYRRQVETELKAVCLEVLDLLENTMIKINTEQNEARVFYLKMAADYYRYLAEVFASEGYDKQAGKLYAQALEIAETKMDSTHPIRLGLALNYSVCFYEILKDKTQACDLARKAFDAAISKLDQLEDTTMYKDSSIILQLLRDNLALWTQDSSAAENN